MMIEQLESRQMLCASVSTTPSTTQSSQIERAAPLVVAPTALDLSPTVASTTLPAAVVAGTPVSGSATVLVNNLAADKASGKITIALYIVPSGGTIDSSMSPFVTQPFVVAILANGSAKYVVHIKSLPASLSDGAYTVLAQTTDALGNTAASTAGPSVQVAAPFIDLSETETAHGLASAVIGGAHTAATVQVSISNAGNISTSKPTLVQIYASADGTIDGNATLIASSSPPAHINPGKTANATVALKSFPDLAMNTYDLITQVTDQNGDVTTSPASISVTISPPFIALTTHKVTSKIGLGDPITGHFNYLISNDGTGICNGTVTLALYVIPDVLTTYVGSVDWGAVLRLFSPLVTDPVPMVLNPHQEKLVMLPTATIYPSRSLAEADVVCSVTDPEGNVTYAYLGVLEDFSGDL